jgi:hypothetical protein
MFCQTIFQSWTIKGSHKITSRLHLTISSQWKNVLLKIMHKNGPLNCIITNKTLLLSCNGRPTDWKIWRKEGITSSYQNLFFLPQPTVSLHHPSGGRNVVGEHTSRCINRVSKGAEMLLVAVRFAQYFHVITVSRHLPEEGGGGSRTPH